MAFLMIGFGMNAKTRYQQRAEEVAIRVNDHEIKTTEYERQLENLTVMARDRFKQNFPAVRAMLNLEQRAIDSLIEQKVFEDLVADLGMGASTVQIQAYLQGLPFFQHFGLNRDTYTSFLQSEGMSGDMLERRMQDEVARQQLQRVMTDLNEPTEEEMKAAFRAKNAVTEFEYAELDPKQFESKVDVSDEAKLKSYLGSHSQSYQRPRSVRYTYVRFQPSEFLDRVDVSQEDVRERYERKQSQYVEPKQIKVRQIVLEKKDEGTPELEKLVTGDKKPEQPKDKAKEIASDIVDRLKKGGDFSELAKQFSEDKETAQKGGDRGWISPNALPPAVREVVERMEQGKYSDVIQSGNQYYVMFLDEVKERRQKPFEEVKAQLETELRNDDAPEYARADAEGFLDRWLNEQNTKLADFAAKEKRTAQDSGKLLASTEDAPGAAGLTAKVLSFPKGERQLVRVGNDQFVVEITDTKDAYVPDFAEIRDAVKKDYVAQESHRLAKEAAEKLLKDAKGGKPLAEAARAAGAEVKSTEPATKADAGKDPLFANPENLRVAFSLDESRKLADAPLSGTEGQWYVLQLKSRKLPDEKAFAEQLKDLKEKERGAAGMRLDSFVSESIRAGANVWVNPKLLERSAQYEPTDDV